VARLCGVAECTSERFFVVIRSNPEQFVESCRTRRVLPDGSRQWPATRQSLEQEPPGRIQIRIARGVADCTSERFIIVIRSNTEQLATSCPRRIFPYGSRLRPTMRQSLELVQRVTRGVVGIVVFRAGSKQPTGTWPTPPDHFRWPKLAISQFICQSHAPGSSWQKSSKFAVISDHERISGVNSYFAQSVSEF
jgi:hypothetical protein